MHTSYNELVGAIATRLRELGDLNMQQLRLSAGYGCSTPSEALQVHKHARRGELLEYIILEEFTEEFDQAFDTD